MVTLHWIDTDSDIAFPSRLPSVRFPCATIMKTNIVRILLLSFLVICFCGIGYAQEQKSREEILAIATKFDFHRKIGSTEHMNISYDESNRLTKKYLELYLYSPSIPKPNYQGVYFSDKIFSIKPNYVVVFDNKTGEALFRMGIYNDGVLMAINAIITMSFLMFIIFLPIFIATKKPRFLGLSLMGLPFIVTYLFFHAFLLLPDSINGQGSFGVQIILTLVNLPSSILAYVVMFIGEEIWPVNPMTADFIGSICVLNTFGIIQYYFIGNWLAKRWKKGQKLSS